MAKKLKHVGNAKVYRPVEDYTWVWVMGGVILIMILAV